MQYRKFGNTSLQVSEIGFGAWAIGGAAMIGNTAIGWGDTDDQVSEQAIHRALDNGINFFDTADIYGLGHSEELLGKLINERKDVVIATKVGNVSRNEQFTVDYSKQYMLQACETSLKRLRRDVIDCYQLHTARMVHLQQGECVEAMQLLQQQGKIRYWGLSLNTFEPDAEAEYLLNNQLGSGFQLVLNIINQRALPLVKKAADAGYGIIARMPLQFGLLTGKFTRQTNFGTDDHRSFRLTPSILQHTLAVLEEKVWPIALKTKMSKTALALSFILSYPSVSTVIPGIRTEEHVVQNTSGLQSLDPSDLELLQSMSASDWVPVLEEMERQG